VGVFVDQAAQDGSSADLFCVDVGHGGAGSARFVVGDVLGYALVRPGSVVVDPVLGQDGAQMRVADNQDLSRSKIGFRQVTCRSSGR